MSTENKERDYPARYDEEIADKIYERKSDIFEHAIENWDNYGDTYRTGFVGSSTPEDHIDDMLIYRRGNSGAETMVQILKNMSLDEKTALKIDLKTSIGTFVGEAVHINGFGEDDGVRLTYLVKIKVYDGEKEKESHEIEYVDHFNYTGSNYAENVDEAIEGILDETMDNVEILRRGKDAIVAVL